MKYVKTWMGVITGSMAGRDDGYPERKYRHYNSLEELAKEYGKHEGEEYYEAIPLNAEELQKKVVESLAEQNEKAKEKKKENLQKQIQELQKQLKELS